MDYHIPEKTNKVLNIIILGLLLILVRVWYLSIIQHDTQVEKARKPKRRTVIEKVERATIRDRFNIPLALNKIQYNASICYADIRQIPSAKWEINAEGKKVRIPVRSAYIKKLSELLAKELQLDPQVIEDTIHGKASLFPHTPFVLKEDLSENEYYRLKLLEKDWVGICTEKGSKRYYPLGKVGSDVIGYMGAISSKEYYTIATELSALQEYLAMREANEPTVLPKGYQNPLEVREHLRALQEKAYTVNDLIGKAGIEGAFDSELRGYSGKKTYEVDTKGNFLRELPGSRKEISGQRLILSISAQLQEFAEQLLAQNEDVRQTVHPDGEADLSTPWIKGGAIVALDPKTGQVLSLASYPRLDPNDFISSRIPEVRASKQAAVIKWLENEAYIGEIWDGKRPLERERYDESNKGMYTQSLDLTLPRYFETILSPQSRIYGAMQTVSSLQVAALLQKELEKLLQLSGQTKMCTLINALYSDQTHRATKITVAPEEKKSAQQQLEQNGLETALSRKKIDPILEQIKHNDDKLLLIDLCRMIVDGTSFSEELIASVGSLSLGNYRLLNQSVSTIVGFLQSHAKKWFHEGEFQKYREVEFKEHLKEKRKEERQKKKYAKPYTDYLEQIEKKMFQAFWEKNRESLLHAFIMERSSDHIEQIAKLKESYPEMRKHAEKLKVAIGFLDDNLQRKFLKTFRSFDELMRPLYGRYRSLRNSKGIQLEKHLAAAFYPIAGYGYGRSQAFRQTTPQGSLFKLVVAYQALLERCQTLKEIENNIGEMNPLTLVDNLQWHPKNRSIEQVMGYTVDGKPIKRLYKGGNLTRSSHPNIGKIDILGAIEQSSNIYFSILTVDCMEDPINLIHASRSFGFGEKTGIELPGEIAGSLPNDVSYNRTGLYAFAIGQHSLIVTPLQTAIMLGAIANKGEILKPKVVQVIAGKESLREYEDPFSHEKLQEPAPKTSFKFKDSLASIGIHFPLFTSTLSDDTNPYIWYNATEIRRKLPMPDNVRDPLIEGMRRVIMGPKGNARPHTIRALLNNPVWMREFQEMKHQLIGKTGTAEILYKQSIDSESEAKIQNHIWFGGVAFSPESPQTWETPELVVIVYLRFSKTGGKEAAPLATRMIKKWREICEQHGQSGYIVYPNNLKS